MQKEFETVHFLFGNGVTFDLTGIRMLSWISAENTILVVLCSALLIKMLKSFNDLKILYVGLFIYTIGFTILGTSNSLWILLIAGLFQTVGDDVCMCQCVNLLWQIWYQMRREVHIWRLTEWSFKWQNERGIRCYARLIFASWGMSALYFIVGMSSILLFMKAIGRV